ncbi:MAG: sigma-E processing peptidase SpoIIGA [Defluviitaleaceae bacterium]|nr:sigma-E processing peptidase SpoIIGA [Defluviitaleaceae bacterium]MCL2262172.1 sigma-E processing peptidase SpoIIGA [Defluviitaleaceae bacterium]
MTLYADILFLVNLVMNGFVLWVLSKVVREPRKTRWLLLGASLMALLYTMIIVTPPLRFVNVVLASVVILAVGVSATFHPRGAGAFFRLMAAAYVISFTVGGLGMALFFLTDLPYAVYFIVSDFGGFSRLVSWQLVLAGMIVSYITIKFALKIAERFTLKRQMLCNVHISLGENDCNFDALVDTGHNLKEPLSQTPVIIAEFEQIKPLLPECLVVLFSEKLEDDLTVLLSVREEAFYNRIRMIPFKSLGQSNGILIGFRPDNVKVEGLEESPDVVIGIYNAKLCRDGRYRGLLSPELVA